MKYFYRDAQKKLRLRRISSDMIEYAPIHEDFVKHMRSASQIARYLVGIGYSHESPEESVLICPLRLQKLLYYCQGWSLALLGRPLFSDVIEAWPKGPVVVEVYKLYRGKNDGIQPDDGEHAIGEIGVTERKIIESVWQHYSGFTPNQLIRKTHSEPAWLEARQGLAPDEKSSNPLSLETMRAFFTQSAKRKTVAGNFPTPDPADVWEADEEFEQTAGQGASIRDAVRIAKSKRAIAS